MRHFVLILALSIAIAPFAASAQTGYFDPFRDKGSHPGSDYNPEVRDSRPSVKNDAKSPSVSGNTGSMRSGLMDLKLSDYDQTMFDNCRSEALSGGSDIMQIRNATSFLKAPYRNQSCAKFVVEKMLNGMDTAMRNNPEALLEFQRSKDAQRKYDELKKAYIILGRGNPVAADNSGDFYPFLSNKTKTESSTGGFNSLSANQLLSKPFSVPPEESYDLTPAAKTYVPQDWWSKDYLQVDMAKIQAQIASRQEHNNRVLTPEASGPNPLKSIMMEAEQKGQSQSNRGRRQGGTLPSFEHTQ